MIRVHEFRLQNSNFQSCLNYIHELLNCSSLIWRTITTPTAVRSYGVLVVVVVVVVVVVLVLFPSLFSRRAPCPNLASPFVFRSLSSLPAFLRSPLFGILAALCVFLYGVHATFAV